MGGFQPGFCLPWQARIILEKATKVSFKQVDDLASVWCECGELELRHENYDQALRLLRVSTCRVVRQGCRCAASLGCPMQAPLLCCLPVEGDSTACSPGRVLRWLGACAEPRVQVTEGVVHAR